jgi:hypothetical protein
MAGALVLAERSFVIRIAGILAGTLICGIVDVAAGSNLVSGAGAGCTTGAAVLVTASEADSGGAGVAAVVGAESYVGSLIGSTVGEVDGIDTAEASTVVEVSNMALVDGVVSGSRVGTLSDVTAVAKAGAGAGVYCTTGAAEYVIVGAVEAGSVSSGVASGEAVVTGGSAVVVSLIFIASVSSTLAVSSCNIGCGKVICGGGKGEGCGFG